jgi:hypothetical protein
MDIGGRDLVLLQRIHVIVESGVGGCIADEINVDLAPWIVSHSAAFWTKGQSMALGFYLNPSLELLDLDSPPRIRILGLHLFPAVNRF